MKLIVFLCIASVCGAGGLVLAQATQPPAPSLSASSRVTFGRPSLVVPHGFQVRYGLAPRGNQTAANADVIVRFESIPEATLQSLRQTHSKLLYDRPALTAAHVTVDALNDQLPGRLIKALPAADGTSALEVRVPAPVGGWYLQPLRLGYEVSSHGRSLYSSDGIVTFAP